MALKPVSQKEAVSLSNSTLAEENPSMQQLNQRISLLEQDLSDEVAARLALEARLIDVEQTKSLSTLMATIDQPSNNAVEVSDPNTQLNQEIATVEEKLVAIGMPEDTIQAMKLTVDQNQLEMLQLRDRAIREGWDNSNDYTEEMFALRNPYRGLQEQFGDEAYDQYLYATGTPNRVEVREVYSGSAADNAGIRPGDLLVSYASTPVFSMSDLRQSTLEGTSGETILVELIRDDQEYTTSVTRGPLGISMSATVVKPD